MPLRVGLGYALNLAGEGVWIGAFGHAGFGGSTGFAVPDQRFAFALAKNRFGHDPATGQVLEAIRDSLGLG